MTTSVHRLRQVSEACRAGEPLDEDLARWLGGCVNCFLDRAVESFAEAFELPSRRGGLPWWKVDRIRRRDAALRTLAAHFPAEISLTARARQIKQLAFRYAAGAWCRDRRLDDMPRAYAGTAKELIWEAFRSGAPMPLSERQIRNIIAAP